MLNFNSGYLRPQFLVLVAIAAAAIVLSLFTHSPVSDENWGYWLFARIFADTGEFITPDRSPLYTVYLNGFRWIGYPGAVAVEYLVTTTIVTFAFVGLFRKYLGLPMAVFTAILWIPFLQQAAPAVQPLALACSFWAMALRRSENSKTGWAGAYALFALATMFRFSYVIFILLYGLWDVYKVLKRRKVWKVLSDVRLSSVTGWIGGIRGHNQGSGHSIPLLIKIGWPIAVVAVLFVWFGAMQSPSRWNNGNFETMTWYPVDNPKSMSNIAFIHGFNHKYVEWKYGTYEGRDFYFTNDELFDGKTDTVGAFLANPRFVVEQVGRNFRDSPQWIASFSVLRPTYIKLGLPWTSVFNYLLILAIAYGALRLTFRTPLFLFVVGNTVIVLSSIAILPEFTRHFVPIIPVLILSAYWYGTRSKDILSPGARTTDQLLVMAGAAGLALLSAFLVWKGVSSSTVNGQILIAVFAGYALSLASIFIGRYGASPRYGEWARKGRRLMAWSALPVFLILFSSALTFWPDLARDVARDVRDGTVQVLGETAAGSPGDSLAVIQPLVSGCQGLLTMEHKFFGGFMDLPTSNIYDVFEVPPFGTLSDPAYPGLNPGRIDCVAVSDKLASATGRNVNIKLRYQNYVEPYVKQLQEAGAVTHQIQDYGHVVVLPR